MSQLQTADATKTAGTPAPRHKRLLRYAEHLLAVAGLFFIVWHCCFQMLVMTSDSMAPTLKGTSYENGDRILVEKVTRWFRGPRRWEVQFMYDAEGTPVTKRVVALPGEKIALRDNRIYINGREVKRPAALESLRYLDLGNLRGGREVDCSEGYFVLGDDSKDSYDSRYLGPVGPKQFRGRAWCILWPFSRFGFVR